VDSLIFEQNQMFAAVGGAAFVVGALCTFILMRLISGSSRKEDPRNHMIRQLEADLRAARRQVDDLEQALAEKTQEFDTAVENMQELRVKLADRDDEVEDLNAELKQESRKTRELRQELQERATQTIREQVRASEAETELEVARAGSEAVMSEITRLQEERINMTNTMRMLETQLMPEQPEEED
jgi:uncharacterized membrane-anchored protein YhcB (DUF1043 family)